MERLGAENPEVSEPQKDKPWWVFYGERLYPKGTSGYQDVMELRLKDEYASIIRHIASGLDISRDGKFFPWDIKLVARVLL